MNTTITTPMDIYQLLNLLISNKGLNIKKLYSINKEILEEDKITIKNIYCKNKTNKNNLCLNKCIQESKYCSIHDPIMRENRIINRRTMNIRRRKLKLWDKVSKELLEINYEIDNEYKPSAPLYEEIVEQTIDPPVYEQKPDECGTTIKNFINNNNINPIFKDSEIVNKITKAINNMEINNINKFKLFSSKAALNLNFEDQICTEGIVHTNNVRLLAIDHFRDSQGNIDKLLQPLIPVKIDSISNTEEILSNVEDYKKQLLNIDYSIYQPYPGVQLRRLCTSLIEFQFKLYNSNNNINSKTIKFINNIIKHIPK